MGSKYIVEEEYFQVTELSEDGTMATLKDWAEGSLDGGTRTIKVRWEEDAEIIRDGLLREDKELFCTVLKIMEKEVMINFELKLRDPPILKMPDLVMDMIFSSMSLEDILLSRSVCPEWGFGNLPIQRVFSCKNLSFFDSFYEPTDVVLYEPYRLFTVPYGKRLYAISIDLMNLPAMIEASLFEHLKKLDISYFYDPQLPGILEKIHKTKKLSYCDEQIDTESWNSVQKFIANNNQHLKSVRMDTVIPEDIVKLEVFANSTSLESLQLILCRGNSLGNLESLPSCITHLSLLKLSIPLSSAQVSWIVTNLTKLIKLELHTKHTHCEDEEEDEGDLKGSMIADIVSNHPTLQIMNLGFGDWNGRYEEEEEVCKAVREMKTYLEEQLRKKGWEFKADDTFTIIERLSMNKVGYQQVESYEDWEW